MNKQYESNLKHALEKRKQTLIRAQEISGDEDPFLKVQLVELNTNLQNLQDDILIRDT